MAKASHSTQQTVRRLPKANSKPRSSPPPPEQRAKVGTVDPHSWLPSFAVEEIRDAADLAVVEARFDGSLAQHFIAVGNRLTPATISTVEHLLMADDQSDAGLNDGAGAIRTREPRAIERSAFRAFTLAAGREDRIAFRVFDEAVLLRPGQAIAACHADRKAVRPAADHLAFSLTNTAPFWVCGSSE